MIPQNCLIEGLLAFCFRCQGVFSNFSFFSYILRFQRALNCLVHGERDQVGVTAQKKMSLASNFQVEMIKNFGPNWYQEKTKYLKLHLGKFAGLVVDSFAVDEPVQELRKF